MCPVLKIAAMFGVARPVSMIVEFAIILVATTTPAACKTVTALGAVRPL